MNNLKSALENTRSRLWSVENTDNKAVVELSETAKAMQKAAQLKREAEQRELEIKLQEATDSAQRFQATLKFQQEQMKKAAKEKAALESDIVSMKFEDHLKYITLDGHAYMAALWWMNDDTFSGLSDANKRIVIDGFDHLKTVTRAAPMRNQIAAIETFKKAGGSVYVPTAEQKAAFQAAAKPMEKWYTDKFGDEWLVKAQAAISDCVAKIDAEL